jgi:hypothetical protein
MPPIERTDVREGVRDRFPPPPEHCIAQVLRVKFCFQVHNLNSSFRC